MGRIELRVPRDREGRFRTELAAGLDTQVEQSNERPLSGAMYPFVRVDAMGIKVRPDGAVRPTRLLIARR